MHAFAPSGQPFAAQRATARSVHPAARPSGAPRDGRLHGLRFCRAALPDGFSGNRGGLAESSGGEDVWSRLSLIKRQLGVAVAEEDFSLAARLRDESRALAARLSPVQQFMFAQADKLRGGSAAERLEAIGALGQAADETVLPDLEACLKDAALQGAAEEAMWAIFSRAGEPRVAELMQQGLLFMNAGQMERALAVFEQVTHIAPSFAEGHNKRATVNYLLGRYADSVADCEMVLQLNPHHFAAASGMGLCYIKLQRPADALAAFERALEIHPGLAQIANYVEALRADAGGGSRSSIDGDSDGDS